MVPFAIAGIIAFALATVVLYLFRDTLEAHGNGSWIWISVAGFFLGFPGLAVMIRHDANRRRRHQP
jgi:predicted PurR-regulated permease PerM